MTHTTQQHIENLKTDAFNRGIEAGREEYRLEVVTRFVAFRGSFFAVWDGIINAVLSGSARVLMREQYDAMKKMLSDIENNVL